MKNHSGTFIWEYGLLVSFSNLPVSGTSHSRAGPLSYLVKKTSLESVYQCGVTFPVTLYSRSTHGPPSRSSKSETVSSQFFNPKALLTTLWYISHLSAVTTEGSYENRLGPSTFSSPVHIPTRLVLFFCLKRNIGQERSLLVLNDSRT